MGLFYEEGLQESLNKWAGRAWLCPDCGKVLRKPPSKELIDGLVHYYHSYKCKRELRPIVIKLAYPFQQRGTP